MRSHAMHSAAGACPGQSVAAAAGHVIREIITILGRDQALRRPRGDILLALGCLLRVSKEAYERCKVSQSVSQSVSQG